MRTSIARVASSDETASLASCPKTLSGAGSGVTIVIRTSRRAAGAALGHERELVDGQRPTSAGGTMNAMRLNSCSEARRNSASMSIGSPEVRSGLGAGERAPRLGPDADDRRVEVEGRAVIESAMRRFVDSAPPSERTYP